MNLLKLTRSYSSYTLNIENMNKHIKAMDWHLAPIMLKLQQVDKELMCGTKKSYPYLIRATRSDLASMQQPPFTFNRQVIATMFDNSLLEHPCIPEDVKERAQKLMKFLRNGSVGSYTDSTGVEYIRKNVAKFIEKRDGHPSNHDDVVITSGSTDAIKKILELFVNEKEGKPAGVLLPKPGYPLYRATCEEYGLKCVHYSLNEDCNWSIDLEEVKECLDEAKKSCNPKVLVIINPGNPTGHVLSRKTVEELIQFAHCEKLFVLADEVYQKNVYNSEFVSFKKVYMDMGDPYDKCDFASVNSVSFGKMCEAGLRGGYTEVCNLLPDVKANYFKLLSSNLCPSSISQALVDILVDPPRKGDESYELWKCETESLLGELEKKARNAHGLFQGLDGIVCNEIFGSLFLFPRIEIPNRAVEEAKKKKIAPDVLYAMELIDQAGVAVLPGSQFGQEDGTWHVRVSITAPLDLFNEMLDRWKVFHTKFIQKYG